GTRPPMRIARGEGRSPAPHALRSARPPVHGVPALIQLSAAQGERVTPTRAIPPRLAAAICPWWARAATLATRDRYGSPGRRTLDPQPWPPGPVAHRAPHGCRRLGGGRWPRLPVPITAAVRDGLRVVVTTGGARSRPRRRHALGPPAPALTPPAPRSARPGRAGCRTAALHTRPAPARAPRPMRP